MASNVVQAFLEEDNIKLQLVELHNHIINLVEWSTQKIRNHFTSSLCTTYINPPLQLWDVLIIQGQESLKFLRNSHKHPHL